MEAKSSEKSEIKLKTEKFLASKVGAAVRARDGEPMLHRYKISVFLAKKVA